jgi:hypothetical protein
MMFRKRKGATMYKKTPRGFPWDEDPYELRYDEAAGMFTEDEVVVLEIDFKKRNWRKEHNMC